MVPVLLKNSTQIHQKILLLIVIILALILAAFLVANRKPQTTSSNASNSISVQKVKDELQTKSLGSLCVENGGRVISPFEQCGKRGSEDKNNPLYYCCE